MSRPTMREIYQSRLAEEITKPLVAPPTALPVAFLGFADLDIGEDMDGFLKGMEVRDRLGPDLLRLVATVHGSGDLTKMVLTARSPAFWTDLDCGDLFRAFHRLMEIRTVTAQAAAVKRRH